MLTSPLQVGSADPFKMHKRVQSVGPDSAGHTARGGRGAAAGLAEGEAQGERGDLPSPPPLPYGHGLQPPTFMRVTSFSAFSR